MQESTTVRVDQQTHKRLKELAEESGESLSEVLGKAIEAYRRQRFLEEANAAFAALRNDRAGWEHERQERAAWDATLSDDLEGD